MSARERYKHEWWVADPTRQMVYHLVQPLRRAHAGLDSQAAYILPRLLQQTDQVIDSQHDVGNQLIFRHAHISHCDTQAQYLLQLELDCALDFSDFGIEVFGVGNGRGELAGLRQTGSEETRYLLDQGVGGNEGVVLAGKLLDQLLVLVELLEIVGGHGIDAVVLGAIDVVLVTENAGSDC